MIRKKKAGKKRVIDISGPDGNAYVILGIAKGYAEQLELDWDKIHTEMTSGNYENLLKVFDKYFGKVCDLER